MLKQKSIKPKEILEVMLLLKFALGIYVTCQVEVVAQAPKETTNKTNTVPVTVIPQTVLKMKTNFIRNYNTSMPKQKFTSMEKSLKELDNTDGRYCNDECV
jgi:hypothetical protein